LGVVVGAAVGAAVGYWQQPIKRTTFNELNNVVDKVKEGFNTAVSKYKNPRVR
jgi:hypothetical protein